jgi:uncharacterized membrane protein YgcG
MHFTHIMRHSSQLKQHMRMCVFGNGEDIGHAGECIAVMPPSPDVQEADLQRLLHDAVLAKDYTTAGKIQKELQSFVQAEEVVVVDDDWEDESAAESAEVNGVELVEATTDSIRAASPAEIGAASPFGHGVLDYWEEDNIVTTGRSFRTKGHHPHPPPKGPVRTSMLDDLLKKEKDQLLKDSAADEQHSHGGMNEHDPRHTLLKEIAEEEAREAAEVAEALQRLSRLRQANARKAVPKPRAPTAGEQSERCNRLSTHHHSPRAPGTLRAVRMQLVIRAKRVHGAASGRVMLPAACARRIQAIWRGRQARAEAAAGAAAGAGAGAGAKTAERRSHLDGVAKTMSSPVRHSPLGPGSGEGAEASSAAAAEAEARPAPGRVLEPFKFHASQEKGVLALLTVALDRVTIEEWQQSEARAAGEAGEAGGQSSGGETGGEKSGAAREEGEAQEAAARQGKVGAVVRGAAHGTGEPASAHGGLHTCVGVGEEVRTIQNCIREARRLAAQGVEAAVTAKRAFPGEDPRGGTPLGTEMELALKVQCCLNNTLARRLEALLRRVEAAAAEHGGQAQEGFSFRLQGEQAREFAELWGLRVEGFCAAAAAAATTGGSTSTSTTGGGGGSGGGGGGGGGSGGGGRQSREKEGQRGKAAAVAAQQQQQQQQHQQQKKKKKKPTKEEEEEEAALWQLEITLAPSAVTSVSMVKVAQAVAARKHRLLRARRLARGTARRPKKGDDDDDGGGGGGGGGGGDDSGGGGMGAAGGFIARITALQAHRKAEHKRKVGEQAYDEKVAQDKKLCPSCGALQSYQEVVEKRRHCNNDGCHKAEYVPALKPVAVNSGESRFFRRLESQREGRAARVAEVAAAAERDDALSNRFHHRLQVRVGAGVGACSRRLRVAAAALLLFPCQNGLAGGGLLPAPFSLLPSPSSLLPSPFSLLPPPSSLLPSLLSLLSLLSAAGPP